MKTHGDEICRCSQRTPRIRCAKEGKNSKREETEIGRRGERPRVMSGNGEIEEEKGGKEGGRVQCEV